LAVINLLPIGALDGGQLLFETIEAIIRRKIPYLVRFGINLASWLLILSLIMFLSYQDIRRAIFGR
jgi:regulator of sigma E protease